MKHAEATRCGDPRGRAGRAAALLCSALLFGALPWGDANALQRGSTAQDRPYVSGGISEDERRDLQAQRASYSLWIVTAAERSGAYLAGARVSIRAAEGEGAPLFEGELDGPWLLIDLPPGRYQVETRWNGQTVRSATTVRAGAQRQIMAYFKFVDDVDLPRDRPEASGPVSREKP